MNAVPFQTPEQRRRNIVLGLILGGIVLGMIVAFILTFRRHGLPKDPEVWKRLTQERSAEAAPPAGDPIGEAVNGTTVSPARATGAQESPR